MIKKQSTNRILSLFLALALVIGTMLTGAPPLTMTAHAATGDASDGVALSTSDKYYFGTYDSDPILWRTLDVNSTEALLLSEDILAIKKIRDYTQETLNTWADSDIREWLNDDTATGFYYTLPPAIKTAIQPATLTDVTPSTTDKVYLLNITEAEALNAVDSNIGAAWWLRSAGSMSEYNACVRADGTVFSNGFAVGNVYGVRPALQLNQSSAIFTIGAADGTSGNPYTITSTQNKTITVGDHVTFAGYTWKVIKDDGNTVTLLAITNVGTMSHRIFNRWSESDIQTFLNPSVLGAYEANTFAFADGESSAMKATAVSTIGDSSSTDTMFLLSVEEANSGYFTNDADRISNYNNSASFWWLRSPGSSGIGAAYVLPDGRVISGGVDVVDDRGVRPAFKLDPSSVIFTSEILSNTAGRPDATQANANYSAAAGGTKNYKLTVVDTALTAGTVTADSTNISSHPTKTVAVGGSVAVAGSGTAGTKLTYKIVNSSGTIVGYGQGDTTSLTVNAKDLSGTNLADDNYTVYVWAQKDNAASSHTGSTPEYFTMQVGNGAPALSSIAVTNPPGKTTYTAGESFDNTGMVVTAYYDNSTNAPVTGYTVTPSGALTAGTTSVTVSYTENSVTQTTTQAITVNDAPTKTIVVGAQSGTLTEGLAGHAEFIATTANIANSTPVTLNNPNNVAGITLALVQVYNDAAAIVVNTTAATPAGSHPLTVTADGVTSSIFYLTVNAAQPSTYSFAASANTGGSIGSGSTVNGNYAAGTPITVTAVPNSGYVFDGWTATGVAVGDTETISFNMPAGPVTLTADFQQVGDDPYVTPSTLNIITGDTATFTVNLGSNISAAASATVTSDNPAIATATPTNITSSPDTVTVTGVSAGPATISIGWSGGSKDGQTSTVNVNVTDPTPNTHIITAGVNGTGGAISPSGSVIVTEGDDQTFTITPDTGYHIQDVMVDGISVGTPLSYTFTNVTEPHDIYASFEADSSGHDPVNPPVGPINTASNATVTFPGDYAELDEITLNGQTLTQTTNGAHQDLSGYGSYSGVLGKAEQGSVKVTLYKEFLQTLPNGTYTLIVGFDDGSAGSTPIQIQHPAPPPVDNNTGSGSGSGGGGGGGGGITSTALAPATTWLNQSAAQALATGAKSRGENYVRTKSTGAYGVRGNVWAKLMGLRYEHDTMIAGSVQVRVYISDPAKLTKDTMVSGYVKGSAVDKIKAHFEKWFGNKVRVVHFDQQGNFGQPVQIAAKVDLTGMDTKKLVFYAYDKATNSYHRIEKPAYWIDSNGYLHFTTEYAGDIVISEGQLERK